MTPPLMSIDEVIRSPLFEDAVDRRAKRLVENLLVGPGLRQHLALRGIPADRVQPPFFKVTYPIHALGPLDKSGTFTKEKDDTALIMWFSGSGFRSGSAGMMEIELKVDGVKYGSLFGFTNELGSHKSLVSSPMVFPDTSIPAPKILKGEHTVSMVDTASIETDGNDPFYCLVFETYMTTT